MKKEHHVPLLLAFPEFEKRKPNNIRNTPISFAPKKKVRPSLKRKINWSNRFKRQQKLSELTTKNNLPILKTTFNLLPDRQYWIEKKEEDPIIISKKPKSQWLCLNKLITLFSHFLPL